jgi:threonine dehydrogenase-like Zn-dependent dehydrogenase
MKALVYTQPGAMQLLDRPLPEAAADEVLLKIEAVGICGSDMHAWHGHDPRRLPGLVLGHEFVGTIERSAAPGFETGVRYTGNPLIVCGTCEYCVQGRNNLCANRTMVGMTRPGAFAEYMSIPAASLIAMPQHMDTVAAALTEPAASPMLRTLITPGTSASACTARSKCGASARTRAGNLSCSSVSSIASAAAQASGWPEQV